jgi:transposase
LKDVSFYSRIFLAVEPVDFRKQAHSLALLVEHSFELAAHNEKWLFAFTNKRRTAIKLLHWDQTGYGMWWKVLEKDKFCWPASSEQVKNIQPKELKWLLGGIDIFNLKKHKKIDI